MPDRVTADKGVGRKISRGKRNANGKKTEI